MRNIFLISALTFALFTQTASAKNYACNAEHPQCPVGKVCDTKAKKCVLAPQPTPDDGWRCEDHVMNPEFCR